MMKTLLIFVLIIPWAAAAQEIPEEDKIYLCMEGDVIVGARNESSVKCPEPAVNQKTHQPWLDKLEADRNPSQDVIDAQYEKLHCNQTGDRETLLLLGDILGETLDEVCDMKKGKRR